jgi:hypothetical protein
VQSAGASQYVPATQLPDASGYGASNVETS